MDRGQARQWKGQGVVMVYKRATKRLIEAGIINIEICKGVHGASPIMTGVKRQTTKVFDDANQAAEAVLSGFRPTVVESK
jgi:hypothetical protein